MSVKDIIRENLKIRLQTVDEDETSKTVKVVALWGDEVLEETETFQLDK